MRRRNGDVVERHGTRRGAIEAGNGAEQRRLSAAGAADDGDDLTEMDGGGKTLQRMDAVRIDFSDSLEHQHQAAPSSRPKASCQRNSGAAAISISQSVVLPRMAKITIAARICAGLPSCWPSSRRLPSPPAPPLSSRAITNNHPKPTH